MMGKYRLSGIAILTLAMTAAGVGTTMAQKSAPAAKPGMSDMSTGAAKQDENRGKLEIKLGGKAVSIDYGRPEMKGRDMLAQAPDGYVWRFGMDESTTFKTDANLMFGDKKLMKGTYSALMKHVKGEQWSLIFNKEVGIQGDPSGIRANDVLEVPFTYSKSARSVEKFTVQLMQMSGGGHLMANWGTHQLDIMFKAQ